MPMHASSASLALCGNAAPPQVGIPASWLRIRRSGPEVRFWKLSRGQLMGHGQTGNFQRVIQKNV
jgi:hypothetical protein